MQLEGAKQLGCKLLEVDQRYVRASASHERRDSGVGIAEGALEHGELVAVAPELLAHGGACASQPSDGAVTAHVQLGLAARGVAASRTRSLTVGC